MLYLLKTFLEKNYSQAMSYYGKSLEIANEYKIKDEIAIIYMNLGHIHLQKGNSKLGLQLIQNAGEIFRTTNNIEKEALSLEQIGLFFYDNGDYNCFIRSFTLYGIYEKLT